MRIFSPEERKRLEEKFSYLAREREIRAYQRKNPFSYREWNIAFTSGWLCQHGIRYWQFPSPEFYRRGMEISLLQRRCPLCGSVLFPLERGEIFKDKTELVCSSQSCKFKDWDYLRKKDSFFLGE